MTWWTLIPVWQSPSITWRILSARRRGWSRTDHRWSTAQSTSVVLESLLVVLQVFMKAFAIMSLHCSTLHITQLKLKSASVFLSLFLGWPVFVCNRRERPYSRHWRAWTWTAAQWRTWVWTSPFQDSRTLSWKRAAKMSQSQSTTWRSTSGYVIQF